MFFSSDVHPTTPTATPTNRSPGAGHPLKGRMIFLMESVRAAAIVGLIDPIIHGSASAAAPMDNWSGPRCWMPAVASAISVRNRRRERNMSGGGGGGCSCHVLRRQQLKGPSHYGQTGGCNQVLFSLLLLLVVVDDCLC